MILKVESGLDDYLHEIAKLGNWKNEIKRIKDMFSNNKGEMILI